MDHRRQFFTDSIDQAKEAIARYTNSAEQDEAFVQEFKTTDPAIAEIYRGWKKFNLDKIALLRSRMTELTSAFAKEYPDIQR